MLKPYFKKWQFQSKSKRPFILPTRFAYGFSGLSILLLMIGFMYANNLLLLYLFFLVSVGLATIGWTHRNFEFTHVLGVDAEDFFAGEEGSLLMTLDNTSKAKTYAFQLSFRKSPEKMVLIPVIEAKTKTEVVLPATFQTRGLQSIPQITLGSKYPYGLFYCWKYFSPLQQIEVFPAKIGSRLNRASRPANSIATKDKSDFMGHRLWNTSDSFRKIDWKVKARTGELMVQIHHEPQPQELVISWRQSQIAGDTEARLCQMSQWIYDAAQLQESFKVQVEGVWQSDWGRGSAHLKTCLSKLNALFPVASAARPQA